MATVAQPEQQENPLVEGLERLPVHPTTLVIFGGTGDLAKRKLQAIEAQIAGLRAEGPVRVGDAVGVSVVLDFRGGLAPGPPAPGRLWHRSERLQDIAGTVGLDGQPGSTGELDRLDLTRLYDAEWAARQAKEAKDSQQAAKKKGGGKR